MKMNESKPHSVIQINLTIMSEKARYKVYTHLYEVQYVKEKGPHINLTSSGEALEEALQTQSPKVTTKDGIKLKLN